MSSGQRSTPAAATTETNPQVNNKLFVPHRATRHEPQPAPRLERLGPWQRLGPRRARQVAHHSVALLPKQSPHCRHPWPPKARIGPPQRQGQRPLLARSAFRCRLPTPSPSPPPAHSSWQPPQGRRPHCRPGGRPSTPIATSQRPRQTAPGLSGLAKRPSVCNPRRKRPPQRMSPSRTRAARPQDRGLRGPSGLGRAGSAGTPSGGGRACGRRS